jgi:hypothetical protein
LRKWLSLILIPLLAVACGCADTKSHSRAIYMLLDSSGTYSKELKAAQAIVNYILGTLDPGDSFAVAKIDSASFTEKDILVKMTFDRRPSVANKQKRLFKQKVENYLSSVTKGSAYTDITGGILQAVEYLNETGAGKKRILIFSDLREDLKQGQKRNFGIRVTGCQIVALNVTKLRSDNVDPREYYSRVEKWKKRIETGGGTWRVINDLGRLDSILGS